MKALEIVKKGIALTVGLGVMNIVNNIVKSTTPIGTSGLTKLVISIGSLAISGCVTAHVVGHTEKEVEKQIDVFKEELKELEEKEKKEKEKEKEEEKQA